jgi:hypothetical protein
MKSIGSLILLFLLSLTAGAQTDQFLNPELKTGLVLEYEVSAQGQMLPLILKISQIGADGITFDYNIMSNMSGKFINSAANLEKGNSLNWDQPVAGEERKLPDDQTIAMVSRSFLKELKANKKAKYDNTDLQLKDVPADNAVSIGGKAVKTVYAESDGGSTRYWILDNDDFPLLLKLSGNANGVDLVLKDIR